MFVVKRNIIFIFLLSFGVPLQSQTVGYPLTFKTTLSGTFAELRSGHFHSGIDFRTNAKEGYPVIAVEDGYVSRIKVSAIGYGKALYIAHPNGLTSVYAHLQKYNEIITNYLRKEQYAAKTFEIDKYPEKNKLLIRKGDTIGFSGNSGSSEGPHLHFELRESISEKPVNPLAYGIEVTDSEAPIINQIFFYPYGKNAAINGKYKTVKFSPEKKEKQYFMPLSDTVELFGKIGFGIEAWDLQSGNSNKNGIYSFEVFIEDSLVFSLCFDKMDFEETRYINSMIDYPNYYRNNKRIITTNIQPGNNLKSFYKHRKGNGSFDFSDFKTKRIEIVVKDFHSNVSKLSFIGKSVIPVANTTLEKKTASGILFYYDKMNTFKNAELVVEIPPDALYDTMMFDYYVLPKIPGTISKTISIGNPEVPVHKYFKLSIKPDSIPPDLYRKAIIMNVNEKGKLISEGGIWETGFVSTKVRYFGKFVVVADVSPPEIKPLNIYQNKRITEQQKDIRFQVTDDLSGIRNYKATINNKWVLLEYDKKNNLLLYELDENAIQGKNRLIIQAVDDCGNAKEFSVDFIR